MDMYSKLKLIALASFLFTAIAQDTNTGLPRNPHIYMILIEDCSSHQQDIAQTGFLIEGVSGFVTALHGVLDCQYVSAINDYAEDNFEIFENLQLTQIDIEHDLAILTPTTQVLPEKRLLSGSLDLKDTSLEVIGYPEGASEQIRSGATSDGTGQLLSLGSMVNPPIYNALRERGSPNVDIKVITVQNGLLHGYSGAPILNKQGRVVAVGQGGIEGGRLGWAVPWNPESFNFVDATTEEAQRILASLRTSSLLMSTFFGVRLNQLPTFKTFWVYDENREHLYEFEENRRCEDMLFYPDDGHRFTGIFDLDVQRKAATSTPVVNIRDSGRELLVSYCISAGPSLATSRFRGVLRAELRAQQIPLNP